MAIAGQGLLGLVDVGNLLGRDDVTVLGKVLDGFLVGGSHCVQFLGSWGSFVWENSGRSGGNEASLVLIEVG